MEIARRGSERTEQSAVVRQAPGDDVHHFAVAFDVPYVCVMGSTDPMMTDQPEARGEVVRREPLLDCMPCHEKVCPLVHHKCLEDVTPAQVLAAVDRVLALEPRP